MDKSKTIIVLSGAGQGLSRALGGRRWLFSCKTPVCPKRKVNTYWRKRKNREEKQIKTKTNTNTNAITRHQFVQKER